MLSQAPAEVGPVSAAPMPIGPQMVPNPAFLQWQQLKAMREAEEQRRQEDFEAAVALLKSDAAKRFKIDIEADSTIAADEQADQASKTAFLQAVTPFLEAMIPIAQQNPDYRPLISEMIMFGVRAFRVSRALEDAFEAAMERLLNGPAQPSQGIGEGGKSGASPGEIVAQVLDAKAKAAAAFQQNAIKQAQVQGELAIDAQRQQSEAAYHAGRLALEERKIAGNEAFRRAETLAVSSRNADGLV